MLGSQQFDCLYQQDPTPTGSAIFKADWMNQFYPESPLEKAEQCDLVVISADLTFKGNDDSDYNSLQVWGASGADRFLLDEVQIKAESF